MATTKTTLSKLEHDAWEALTSSSQDAQKFYDDVLADDVVMQFPGGMVMTDRKAIVKSFSGEPWEWYRMEDERVLPLTRTSALVTYKATTQRPGGEKYEALMTSGYAKKDGEWKLAFHQQTPV